MHIAKKILLSALGFICIACSDNEVSNNFLDMYGDVLLAKLENPNSINAQYAIDSVMEYHGYTTESFSTEFEKFSMNDPDFDKKIDSLRNMIKDRATELDSISNSNIQIKDSLEKLKIKE